MERHLNIQDILSFSNLPPGGDDFDAQVKKWPNLMNGCLNISYQKVLKIQSSGSITPKFTGIDSIFSLKYKQVHRKLAIGFQIKH